MKGLMSEKLYLLNDAILINLKRCTYLFVRDLDEHILVDSQTITTLYV